MIYGAMRDKAVEEIAEILFPLAAGVDFDGSGCPRARFGRRLCGNWPGRGGCAKDCRGNGNSERGAWRPRIVVVVTGSLFLIGEARRCVF